ncbi:ATP-binding protein [Paenibacillus cellulosilyticus]|nr:DUF87 domain-containing protein [Paenibacillus cellulosilyticus]QKS44130.1 ATP-binding protein [Paenibacillus cellulosilyticus]
MKYYRMKRFDVEDKKDSYYVYHGKEEVELELNAGFTAARDLLEFIHYASTPEKKVSLFIHYDEEKLRYYVQAEGIPIMEQLQSWVPRCEWVEEAFVPDTSFAKEKIVLRGSASPLILKNRDENLLDELIQAMPHETFLIQVKFGVEDAPSIRNQLGNLAQTIESMSNQASVQAGEQANLLGHVNKLVAGGDHPSYQQKDILENHLFTLKSQGAVFSSAEFIIYAGAGQASLLASKMEVFARRSGSLSLQRLRRDEASPVAFLNYTNSHSLAALLAFPMSSIPGFKLNRRVVFGADLVSVSGETINVGMLTLAHETKVPAALPLADLTKHAIVTGVTGSGKTSTIKSLLMQVYEHKKPFLVLEPTKTEYKYLDAVIPDLKRYVLGIDGAFSLKINPFAFPEHIHVQTHLDHLKSLFIAAFPMYGPMPYILETAFYTIYRRTGWDFVSGRNIYASQLSRDQLFPTMEDLYAAVDPAIEAVGYSVDLSSDIRGALKVRIKSLLSGAKGAMLNCRAGNAIGELLQTPAIVELEHVGDEQEKVFLMGLLFISIYEHYVSEGLNHADLQHLLVMEEAHRLLENVKASGHQELADRKGKAVETFNNMLSEIRTYGQGVLIADQIPNKLSPDVMKNTNLKIVHQLFAKDDRKVIGNAIGLKQEEEDELIRLKPGEAIVFHGRTDRAIKVRVHVTKETLASNRRDVQRVETAAFRVEDFLMQQEGYLRKCFRLIHTSLLFPDWRSKAELSAIALMEDDYGLTIPDREQPSLWKKLLERYIRMNHYVNNMTFVQLTRLMNEMESSSDPFGFMLQRMGEIIRKFHAEHPMQRFSNVFLRYQQFRFAYPAAREQFLGFVASQSKPMRYDKILIIDQLLKKAGMQQHFALEFMTAEQRKQLCYAVVLVELDDQPDWLEAFFDVRDIRPSSIVRYGR